MSKMFEVASGFELKTPQPHSKLANIIKLITILILIVLRVTKMRLRGTIIKMKVRFRGTQFDPLGKKWQPVETSNFYQFFEI